MRTRRRPPSHPGSILKLHYLEPSGISVTDLAKELRLSVSSLILWRMTPSIFQKQPPIIMLSLNEWLSPNFL